MKELLVVKILWVEWQQLLMPAGIGVVVLIVEFAKPALFHSSSFYLFLVVSVTASVQLTGVYLVFPSLILPSLATIKIRTVGRAYLLAFLLGIVGYGFGLVLSALFDMPSGAVIVWTYGIAGSYFGVDSACKVSILQCRIESCPFFEFIAKLGIINIVGRNTIIKQVSLLSVMLIFTGVALFSYADSKNGSMGEMMHHNMKHSMGDSRISLGLSPEMKQHQLSNMRSHFEAVQAIISLISKQEFEKTSDITHSKLGLTEEMKRMCNMFDNNDFKALGLAFHDSGDALAAALKTKDTSKSLHAL